MRGIRGLRTVFLNVYHGGHAGGVWQAGSAAVVRRGERDSVVTGAGSRGCVEGRLSSEQAEERPRGEVGVWGVGSASQLGFGVAAAAGGVCFRAWPNFFLAMTSLIANVPLPIVALMRFAT